MTNEKNMTNLSYFTALLAHAMMWDSSARFASLYDDTAIVSPFFSFSYNTVKCELLEMRADGLAPERPLTVVEVDALLSESGVSAKSFWQEACGGDKCPLFLSDVLSIVEVM